MPIPIAMIAAGGMQAGSSILQGFFGANQAKNEAAVNKYNAALMFAKAKAIKMKTTFEQNRQAEAGERVQGDLRASIGGSGIVATQGAPLLSLALQKSESQLQNYLIGYEGRVEANEAISQGQNFLMQADAAKTRARQSLIGGFMGAGTAAFSTWANAAGGDKPPSSFVASGSDSKSKSKSKSGSDSKSKSKSGSDSKSKSKT